MFKNVLLATDFSLRSHVTRILAMGLCSEQGARLAVLHVDSPARHLWEEGVLVPSEEAEQAALKDRRAALQARLDDYVAPMREAGIDVATVIRDGRASEEILEESRERGCDLVIMGSHGGRPILDMLMGDTAAKVSRRSPVPVLIVGGGEG